MRERVRRQYKVVHEKNVPMKTRDGFTLYADVVRPDAPGRYPVLVSRTPYGKDAAMQNTGAPIGSDARQEKAQQAIYHRSEFPSHILLPIIPR